MKRAIKAATGANLSIDIPDKLQMTPLMVAAKVGSDKMVALLLKHGANPERYNLYW